jgi:hypothetical protein
MFLDASGVRKIRGTEETPEQLDEIGLQLAELPVHPAFGEGALERILPPKIPATIARGKVTQDRIRFPDHGAGVAHHRDTRMRIQR